MLPRLLLRLARGSAQLVRCLPARGVSAPATTIGACPALRLPPTLQGAPPARRLHSQTVHGLRKDLVKERTARLQAMLSRMAPKTRAFQASSTSSAQPGDADPSAEQAGANARSGDTKSAKPWTDADAGAGTAAGGPSEGQARAKPPTPVAPNLSKKKTKRIAKKQRTHQQVELTETMTKANLRRIYHQAVGKRFRDVYTNKGQPLLMQFEPGKPNVLVLPSGDVVDSLKQSNEEPPALTIGDDEFDEQLREKRRADRKKLYVLQKHRSFIDYAQTKVTAGKGGDGCVSFRSEMYVEFAGPDGGDGGNGGSVIFRADASYTSLAHIPRALRGEDGKKGQGSDCDGAAGEDRTVSVPVGTVISQRIVESELLSGQATGPVAGVFRALADLDKPGAECLVARGGRRGLGNRRFKSATNRAPSVASPGEPGEEKTVVLELKTVADIGLVGCPNAGKSTLLAALTNAHPAIAPYPFTTLNPYVGVIAFNDLFQMTMADIPGLVAGAHANKGLGHSFLRHVERSKVLVYILDTAGVDGRAPWDDLDTLERELELYSPGLSRGRSQRTGMSSSSGGKADFSRTLVLANKMDLPEAQANYPRLRRHALSKGMSILPISARNAVDDVARVTQEMRTIVERVRQYEAELAQASSSSSSSSKSADARSESDEDAPVFASDAERLAHEKFMESLGMSSDDRKKGKSSKRRSQAFSARRE